MFMSIAVCAVAKQFAVLQNALKFEALHLLSTILSNRYSAPVYDALSLMENDVWSTNIRIGIVAILQNQVESIAAPMLLSVRALSQKSFLGSMRQIGAWTDERG